MATPTTGTAVTLTAAANAMVSYETDLELLLSETGSTGRFLLQNLAVDLGKFMQSVNALAGAPTGGEKTASLAVQTAYNRLARVMAGTDP